MNKENLNKVKRLILALAISGSLNIILLASFFYWVMKERPPTPYCELKPVAKEIGSLPFAIDHSNSELIRRLRVLSFNQLAEKLSSSKPVENGYTERDLALACLAAFHHFDLQRALAGCGWQLQKRSIIYGQRPNGAPAVITVYPGMLDDHFKVIKLFVKTERWPLTPKGLFSLLQKQKNGADPSLIDAFVLTPEFLAIETLFARSSSSIKKNRLLEMLLQGEWKMIEDFKEQQRISQDLSSARRQRFLLDYIQYGAKQAALLLLKTDSLFAENKLEDHHVLKILSLLEEKTPESENFSRSLLVSPRSNAVWKAAAARLYFYAGEPCPKNLQYQAALLRFLPNIAKASSNQVNDRSAILSKKECGSQNENGAPLSKKNLPPAAAVEKKFEASVDVVSKQDQLYLVQDGDNLWRISRRFNVDVEELRRYNKLNSDSLKPGIGLRIPKAR